MDSRPAVIHFSSSPPSLPTTSSHPGRVSLHYIVMRCVWKYERQMRWWVSPHNELAIPNQCHWLQPSSASFLAKPVSVKSWWKATVLISTCLLGLSWTSQFCVIYREFLSSTRAPIGSRSRSTSSMALFLIHILVNLVRLVILAGNNILKCFDWLIPTILPTCQNLSRIQSCPYNLAATHIWITRRVLYMANALA